MLISLYKTLTLLTTKRHSLAAIVLFGLCLWGIPAKAQDLDFKAWTQHIQAYSDSVVNVHMKEQQIPGLSLAIVYRTTWLYQQAYGVRDVESQAPVSAGSVFHTASISKLLTAQAVVQLVEQGKLKLDQSLGELLPQLNYKDDKARSFTIEQLLNHSSGLRDYGFYAWKRQSQSNTALAEHIEGMSLKTRFAPGTDYNYSNPGYDVLGHIIAEVSGIAFEDYVQENILKPSLMQTADFRYFNIPDSLRVSPHTLKGKNLVTRDLYPYSREYGPSSTLNASAKDLGAWMMAFMTELEGEEHPLYKSMLEPSLDDHPYIGLGFQLGSLEGYKKAGHYGGDRGFRSYLMLLPELKLGLVLLANTDRNEDFRQNILHAIAKEAIRTRPGE